MNRKIVQAAVFSFLALAGYAAWLKYEGERQVRSPWVSVADPQEES